ncbi:hypothetical protein HYPSUDRAFT_141276 [Hypholoma sublateritium FD-334 SS-4]|uniref:Fungal-type protein kinase domain-containing protein n=1 Tax=Hypholoma sublateritium (strain FD-334 SS-4) TaxID=945553 RepID=A0A0D2L2Q1_HYPSF|nr:hypothetical protein HYPSUDRAFT_144171 [Hypholoma sublateritium FD-334 SS-4]KJA21022.1 hypothetical protein HYPSUDRAFT_141276 [Hypholoma sublateritium FD-334 SS-4]
MTIDKKTGIVTHITVIGETPTSDGKPVKRVFKVVRPLHATPQISGRATRVWLVCRDDRFYILKDSWPLESTPFSEIIHLLKINRSIKKDPAMYAKLKHTYPIFVVGQELGDGTALRRIELPNKPFPRVHRRIVTKPICDPITSFRSKHELCSVLLDIVVYLKYMSEDCKICHGDISMNNLGINRIMSDHCDDDDEDDENDPDVVISSDSNNNVLPRGLMIDDRNIIPDSNFIIVPSNDSNNGTLPFMALEALRWTDPSKFVHQPKHDLESLFYVILNICSYVMKPGYLRSPTPIINELSICVNEWWHTRDHHVLARTKCSQIDDLDDYILSRLPPYWDDFHPVLQDLQKAIWPLDRSVKKQQSVATHDAFIEIFTKARDRYSTQNEEPCLYAPTPLHASKGSQKRKNSEDDDTTEAKRTKTFSVTTSGS